MTEEKKVKIKLLRGVTGIDFEGQPFTFSAGAEVEVESRLAKDLLNGNAILVGGNKAKETAEAKQLQKEIRNG